MSAQQSLQPDSAAASAALLAVLHHQEDKYDGVIVDANSLPQDHEHFVQQLRHSLQAWRMAGRRGIWLKITTDRAHLVASAVQAGFDFHHAERGYVMLTSWLPEDEEDRLPPNASHQVGVGAFVLNERNEVLVVQEKMGPLRGLGAWKMPTGLVHVGEDLHEAAEREVLEETGVRAAFHRVLAIRQAHGVAFGKSDCFFVLALRPEPGQDELVPQEEEIAAVRWMPLEEYASNPFFENRPGIRKIADLCVAYARWQYAGMDAAKLGSGFGPREDLLMYSTTAEREGHTGITTKL